MIPNIKVTTAMRYVKKVTASRIKDAVKKRKKQQSEQAVSQLINNSTSPSDPTKRMSSRHLSIVLSCICPHTLDDSYKSSEECLTKDGCMLCDMRDLAHCALVNKKWYMAAQPLLSVAFSSFFSLISNCFCLGTETSALRLSITVSLRLSSRLSANETAHSSIEMEKGWISHKQGYGCL